MPEYFINAQGKIETNGLLNEEFQFHELISVPKELIFDCFVAITAKLPVLPNLDAYYLVNHRQKNWQLLYVNEQEEVSEIDIDSVEGLSAIIQTFPEGILVDQQEEYLSQFKKIIINYQNEITIRRNKGNFIDVSHSKVGSFLISTSFGPCQAVAARLTTGEFAIYHAFACYANQPLRQFTDSIKGKVKDIYVFQKAASQPNLKKAPCLAIELAKELGTEVKRLHLENYRCIIADAINNKIILTNEVIYTSSEKIANSELPAASASICSGTKIDLNTAISLHQSVEEFKFENRGNLKPVKGGIKFGELFIPDLLLNLYKKPVNDSAIETPAVGKKL